MKISLNALQVINTIDTYGIFTEAAKKLHRVQSTLFYVVQKLESDLNIKVFDRSGHRVKLTTSEKLLEHKGRRILQATERLEHRVKIIGAGWKAEFRVMVDKIVPFSKLLPHIAAFKNEHRIWRTDNTGKALK